MKHAYVIAFTDSLLTGVSFETALLNLKRVLSEKGHSRLLAQILRASSRELESKLKQKITTVTLAKAGGVSLEKIQAALMLLGVDKASYEEKIDPNLIGGFTMRASGKYLDLSFKSTLLKLYQKVTKS